MAALALAGGTVWTSPDEEPVGDGVVLIENGKIAAAGNIAAPEGAQRIDCSGCTITAGFWNSHVHFFERKWADAAAIPAAELARQFEDVFTRFGFTSVFDLSSDWGNTRVLRARVETGEAAGPRIRSTGPGLLPPNPGLPPDAVTRFMGIVKTGMPEAADAAQAGETARRLLEEGVDGIKLFLSAPSKATLAGDAIRAAVEEAHRAGKPVFVHPNSAADIRAAIEEGVDIVGHTTPASGPWDDALLGAMIGRGAALTPTLTLWKHFLRHDRISVQEQAVRTAAGQLRAWRQAGGAVLFGTDLGAVESDPSEEYALMAEAGMTFREILASLTTAPAERFGDGGRMGRIAPGFEADLVVLSGDPARDPRALSAVKHTLRGGKAIYGAGST